MQVKNVVIPGQLGDADLRLLRVFKSVVECGGMMSAELELNIAVSTISRHIKDLETRLGLVLCRRGRSGFALTPEGSQVYEAALNLLSATDAFRSRLHDIHQRLGGDLHVAVFEKTASNPHSRIAQALREFRLSVPRANVHLHVGPIGVIERGVIDADSPRHARSLLREAWRRFRTERAWRPVRWGLVAGRLCLLAADQVGLHCLVQDGGMAGVCSADGSQGAMLPQQERAWHAVAARQVGLHLLRDFRVHALRPLLPCAALPTWAAHVCFTPAAAVPVRVHLRATRP